MKVKRFRTVRILLLLAIAAGTAYQFLSLGLVALFQRKGNVETDPGEWPAVSVLKPVSGKDEQLAQNLASFCMQDYPRYEVLVGLTDRNDDALPIVEGITRSFPDLARMVIEEGIPGTNRKVANLISLERRSRFGMVAVSDSDMRVGRDYLKTIVGEYLKGARTGLVTCPYVIGEARLTGAKLERLSTACNLFPAILVARCLEGMSFGLGASLLFSKVVLQEIGGFARVADYLADDYQIGHRIKEKGYQVILSRYMMSHVIGRQTFGDCVKHQLRWAVTYRVSRPKGYLASGITHLFPLALLFSLLQGRYALAFPAGALFLRAAVLRQVDREDTGRRSLYESLILLPFHDVLAFGIWLASHFTRKIIWRGRRYRILKRGKFRECD